MRLSACTRSMSERPPRGTMTSTYSLRRSSSPTAARSVVGTSWIAACGSRAACSPSARQPWIARDEWKLAEPHAHALDDEAVGPRPLGQHGADRIRKRRDLLEPARHRLDALVVELEAV